MTAPEDPSTGSPPRDGHPARRRARRVLAGVLIAASAAVIAAPAAQAAVAPGTTTAGASWIVLADPAPSPSPQPTDPGIGLGPSAPTGAPTAPSPITTSDPGTGGSSDPGWFDIPGQIEKAIDDWFGSLIADALTPMLNLLGSTLLGTPDVTAMPRVRALWTQMAMLANAFYILLVLAGAVIVMTHGTVQSRTSAKQIIPRLFVGMIAGNASIALLAVMIHLADAVASAILGGTIDPASAGQALGHMLGPAARGGIFLLLLDLGAQVMLIAILLTYIVRVALTVVLAVAAPLALSLHALPQTEHLARLWWRAITGVFLIQLGQSLVFVVGLDVMLDPTTAVSLFGLPNNSALVDTLVFLALCWILIKIPSWVSRSIFGARSSRLARLAKAVIAYKTLGALGLKRGPGGIPVRKAAAPNRPRPPSGGASWGGTAGGGPRPGGPRPAGGGAGPVIYTVTQVHPNPPARAGIGGARLALPPGTQAPSGHGPRLAGVASPPATPAGNGARVNRGQQVPLPMPGGRRAMQAAATANDLRLARNALRRPEVPGSWREERDALRRPASAGGPRYRQEALFARNPARTNPPRPVAPASGPVTPAPPRNAAATPPNAALRAASTPRAIAPAGATRPAAASSRARTAAAGPAAPSAKPATPARRAATQPRRAKS